MIASIEFVKIDGKRIAINAFDVVVVAEMDEGTQIIHVSTDREDTFITKEDFQDVMLRCIDVLRKLDSDPGDSWKGGSYD